MKRSRAILSSAIDVSLASSAVCVLDVPLLLEGRQAGRAAAPYEAVIVVWVPREVQIERTVARDGCDEADTDCDGTVDGCCSLLDQDCDLRRGIGVLRIGCV